MFFKRSKQKSAASSSSSAASSSSSSSTSSSASQVVFSQQTSSPGLRFGSGGRSVTVSSQDNHWHTAVTDRIFSRGIHSLKLRIVRDTDTTNTWRCAVGVVPLSFNCKQTNYRCVGSLQGGYAYVMSSGNKYSKARDGGKPMEYGPKFSTGDVITVELDLVNDTVQFSHNNTPIGMAYTNINPGNSQQQWRFAVSMTAYNACVEIDSYFVGPPRAEVSSVWLADDLKLDSVNPFGGPSLFPNRSAVDALFSSPQTKAGSLTEAQLQTVFGYKFDDRAANLDVNAWANPLSELAAMGFKRRDALEALMITAKNGVVQLDVSIQYLLSPDKDKAAQFNGELEKARTNATQNGAAPSAPNASPFGSATNSVSGSSSSNSADVQRLMQKMKRQHDMNMRLLSQRHALELRQLQRDVYKESLRAVIADGLVTQAELNLLSECQRERNVTRDEHLRILQELGVNEMQFREMQELARQMPDLENHAASKKGGSGGLRSLVLRRAHSGASAAGGGGGPATAASAADGSVAIGGVSDCVVCLEKVGNFVVLDCMHMCLCEDCIVHYDGKKSAECPVCRRRVRETRRVYW
eukprot:TRINITY_DN66004_c4_g4_i7.p1 TRINITY_DN66004_c4_g4~~TRINITY_DN66004_c4_g4_i7.p1  ORF type:complete len:580 (-),score=234.31 TRINITY_DN66004_c4_g4_i7:1030-2769(-)